MQSLDRRVVLKLGAATLGAAALPARRLVGAPAAPRFFLMLNFQGSLDGSYLFDARPLAMTAAGRIQNYLGKDPGAWLGTNGVSTRATELVAPLKPFQDRFSVLNGVHMAVTFDGHDQNTNMLISGNPFGGDAFFADLNHNAAPTALDFLQIGDLFGGVITNGSAGVTLDADTAKKLSDTVRSSTAAGGEAPVMDLVRSRLAANGGGTGVFSTGSRRMAAGLAQARPLAATIASMTFPATSDADPVVAALAVVQQYFLRGATTSALLTLPRQTVLDTHSQTQAAAQPKAYTQVVKDIVTVFQTLKDTPYDAASGTSLLDVTTVLVASEFGRTMFQAGLAMDKTGTDHNPLANQLLIGGAGVRGGLVVGASDQADVAAPLSGAHKKLDESGVKTMGKPFDVRTLLATDALPDDYDPSHYLNISSVVNTVYKRFNIDPSHYWALGRNLPSAPTLDGLLV